MCDVRRLMVDIVDIEKDNTWHDVDELEQYCQVIV